MNVIVSKDKEGECLCASHCLTYERNELHGGVFCSTGAQDVKTPQDESPCECQRCPIRKEGRFGGTMFCMGIDEGVPRDAYEVIDLTTESAGASGEPTRVIDLTGQMETIRKEEN